MAAANFKPTLPLLLSLNAGFVDTAGFLALQGLFTAHVTGNFVTLSARAWRGGAVFACGRGAEVRPSASIRHFVFDRAAGDADR